MRQSRLLTTAEMKSNEVPKWVNESYRQYEQVVTKPTFPCFFGQKGERKGELRYSYIDHNDWSSLPQTLEEFLLLMNQMPLVRRGLFVFVEPEEKEQNLDYYRRYFWDILQYCNQNDEKGWPEHTPEDPDHHLWSYCFAGRSMFAFANAPAYKQRITRDLGQSLILGFQPREIFQGLEGTEPKGINSREAVRKRVEAWDQIPKHPDISHYGDKDHREWKQFFIGDDCEPVQGGCPFRARNR
ncbi:FPC/CPF motif-containing protein YcgG [Alkalihalobacillus xiaoxiensis]|uniref:FPC/CPF motif-containing protein YcgG n=1 Tax=Shouchella xiaoxiensis TaxID=766895 RepID=A0ABS2SRN7_9BACI|nr:YqcI/YcgG family protein [Shouchella xiaoxiensis]MBM7838168.1 FPC/CPF motif-containing protein YcgG [Shouchella xiaoxiensis]